MTRFRYWLADLISGGELSALSELSTARERGRVDAWAGAMTLRARLEAIEAATRDGKSGTAQKINRMAREALE